MRTIGRIFIVIVFLLVLAVAGAGFLLFTQPGNNIIRPLIEKRINNTLKTNMRLVSFSLRPSYISFVLKTPDGSTLTFSGNYNLFVKGIDADYLLRVNTQERSLKFNNIEIRGPFNIKGHIRGMLKKIVSIKGTSDFASSSINYRIILVKEKPYSVNVKIASLSIGKLLSILKKPPLADGIINADIDVNDLKKGNLKGKALITVVKGMLHGNTLKKIYGINTPTTPFSARADLQLNGFSAHYSTRIVSRIVNASLQGSFDQRKDFVDSSYNLLFNNLSLLKPITNLDIRGRVSVKGTIKGTLAKLAVSGTADPAGSNTRFSFLLEHKNSIENLKATVKHASLSKLLYMLKKPSYASGSINIAASFKTITKKSIRGNVRLDLDNGKPNVALLQKLYGINLKGVRFKVTANTLLDMPIAHFGATIPTTLGTLRVTNGEFNAKKGRTSFAYRVEVPNLNKLYGITHRHLYGKLSLNGKVLTNRNGLIATAHSAILGGIFNAKLENNLITGKAVNIKVVRLTDMLGYKRIFDSMGNIDFNYNLLTQKGIVNAVFYNGHILPNKLTFLLSTMARFDITREIYKTTTVTSHINGKLITSNLDMVSRLTHIVSKNALINLNNNTIDAKLAIEILKKWIYVKLKGNINHPKIKISLKDYLKKKIEKKIKKKLKKKLNNKLKGLLKGLNF